MNMEYLYKGLILGFSVAAPVGPIGVICINRTLNKSFTAGFVSGLGAATADLLYGLIAGLGLTVISTFLINQKSWIQIIGLIFLTYIGFRTIFRKERDIEFISLADKGLLKDYFTTLILTITNPITILFFIAVFAGLGLTDGISGFYPVFLLVLGVFAGSCTWWLFLSGMTEYLKTRLSRNFLKRINLASGLIILIFSLMILLDLIQ
jgi:threonine/homoserine/homoserine lactone efflux protein